MLGIVVLSASGSCSSLGLLTLDLQIVVFTMKLPETDLVLVMERAALRKTFDLDIYLEAFFVAVSTLVVSTATEFRLPQAIDAGFVLNGFLRTSAIGMATVS